MYYVDEWDVSGREYLADSDSVYGKDDWGISHSLAGFPPLKKMEERSSMNTNRSKKFEKESQEEGEKV